MNQAIQSQTNSRLQTDYAVRRVVKFEHLFVGVMRRVVGGDGVNRPVAQAFDDRFEIGARAQRRRHFEVGIVTALVNVSVGQREMMRRDFACDGQAFPLRLPNQIHGARRRNVRDVDSRACQFGESYVARYVQVFGRAWQSVQSHQRGILAFVHGPASRAAAILAMIDYSEIEIARIFQRAPHDSRIGHGLPVVADRYYAGRLHLTDLGQLFAFRSLSDRADWKDVGEFRRAALFDDEASDRRIVVDRLRVRHAADGRETAR